MATQLSEPERPAQSQTIPTTPNQPCAKQHLDFILIAGVLVSFFLPWVARKELISPSTDAFDVHSAFTESLVRISGFDLWRDDHMELKWLVLVPIATAIAIAARFLHKFEKLTAFVAAIPPVIALLILFKRSDDSLFSEMSFGFYLMLLCAAGLVLRSTSLSLDRNAAPFADALSHRGTVVHDHWYALVPNFTFSPSEFYSMVEKALADRQVPGLESFRVEMAEGGLLSASRTYLRLARERLVFDICAAPFGKSFFVSSRFAEIPLIINPFHVLILVAAIGGSFLLFIKWFGLVLGFAAMTALLALGIGLMRNAIGLGLKDLDVTLMKAPIIGAIYEKYFRRETFFRQDARLMYMQTVPEIVKQLVEEVTAAKGIKLLKQYETNAVLNGAYQSVVTRLNNDGAETQPMMVVSMTPFANSPRAEW